MQQVLFEFQILNFESTVRSVASSVATTSSGGSTTATSSSGGGATPTSSSGGGGTVTSSSGGSSTPTSSSGGAAVPTTANQSNNLGTTAGTGGPLIFFTGIQNPTNTFDHTHSIDATNHHHDIANFSHTHTVSISAHTHTVSIAAHTHDVTISAHTHTVSISAHTHTVSISAHTHTVTPVITTEYGIFRESGGNTYGLTDLDFRVNGGSWLNAEDHAVDAGNGWWQIDMTTLVINSTTFRPNQANNLLEIRSLTVDKTATIDAQLSVRNTIQAIAYV